MSPALPLIGGGKTQFQPVYVGDVADAVVAGLDRADARGKTFELGGPQTYSFKELLTYITREIDRPRLLVGLPFPVAQTMGRVADFVFRFNPFAGPPLTGDQVEMLKTDNVVSPGALTLADLGVGPLETVEAITPAYLYRFRPYGQFQTRKKPG
jgi:NADH dehydrogenase